MVNNAAGVKLEQVVKVYDGGTQIIHGIDLEIAPGEFVVFVGPSGCGKSTLMRMVAGLETISGGTISIGGRVVNELPPRERDIAMVFQDYALYPHKNVYDNLAFGLKLRKTPAAEIDTRVRAAAAILKIEHLLERKPRALSGGQRQRVAMGRAIVRNAKLFLFDEPLSNLDALLRSEMRTEIKKLHQRIGATTIYVTHDQVEAMTLAERIVVLSAGRIMQVGTPDDIYHHPVSKFVAGFTGSPPMNFLQATLSGATLRVGHTSLAVPASLHASLVAIDSRPVELGIRPENISASADSTAHAALEVEVVVVEPLGAETLVTFHCAAGDMVARMPPTVSYMPGQRSTVFLDMNKLHLFDPADGMALTVKHALASAA
jgi:multiple sugar transport system ATP-binding protein